MRRTRWIAGLAVVAAAVLATDAAAAVDRSGQARGATHTARAVEALAQAGPAGAASTPGPVPTATLTVPAASAASPAAPVAAPAAYVRPLTTLLSPDLLVTGPRTVTAAQLAAVRAIVGVSSVVPVAVGTVTVGAARLETLGVDPSTFRTVTPAPTAASDALWHSVASGEVTVTYDGAKVDHVPLGATTTIGGAPRRIGALADLRMPGVGAVVDPTLAAALHLTPQAGLVVSAPSRDVVGLERDLVKVLAPETTTTQILRLSLPTPGRATMSAALYRAAARTCAGLPWSVLAAIGGIESDHGADVGVSPAGAEGPMQFLPATFAEYAVDGDHDGQANIDDPVDAVYTAARMLCSDGAAGGGAALSAAIFDYNHASWYVAAVESLAARYAAAG